MTAALVPSSPRPKGSADASAAPCLKVRYSTIAWRFTAWTSSCPSTIASCASFSSRASSPIVTNTPPSGDTNADSPGDSMTRTRTSSLSSAARGVSRRATPSR